MLSYKRCEIASFPEKKRSDAALGAQLVSCGEFKNHPPTQRFWLPISRKVAHI